MSKKLFSLFAGAAVIVAGGFYLKSMVASNSEEVPSSSSAPLNVEKKVLGNSKVEFEKGEHYVEIEQIYGLPENSVVEVLWYGCPHCYNMEKVVQSSEFKEKSKDWNFQQVHIAKNDGPIGFDFKVYAALKQMGLDQTIGKEYMKALHEDGLNRSEFNNFAEQNGISIDAIKSLNENEETKNYYQFISQFSERDGFKGVPAFVVDGKYIVNNKYDIADIANHLLNKDLQR